MDELRFEWDESKNLDNQLKHGVSFEEATYAFMDPDLILVSDARHSHSEYRYFCLGMDKNKTSVLTVRFTYRAGKIRIIGAGYWRKGKSLYGKEDKIH